MSRANIEAFLQKLATDNTFHSLWQSSPDTALNQEGISDPNERAMLQRKDAHEIKDFLKDSYGASLSVEKI